LSQGRSIEGEDLIRDTLGARYTKDARQPESNPSFFEGTAVGERLRARPAEARHVVAAE
jgi:hypothetical protein